MPNDPVQEDLIRRVTLLERRLDNLNLPEKSLLLAAPFLQLPVLRGLWVSSVSNTGAVAPGDWFDLSGLGKTLTYNGNPTVNIYNDRVPYWDYDGVGDYHDRADEADLDILGTETYVAVPGLTLGGWFWLDGGAGTNRAFIGKANAVGQVSYYLYAVNTNALQFVVSTNGNLGAGSSQAVTSGAISTAAWHFCVGRFTPSAERSVFLDGVQTQADGGTFASIFNSNSSLEVGRLLGGNPLDGRCAAAFLCAAAASDAQISAPFQATRAIFGI